MTKSSTRNDSNAVVAARNDPARPIILVGDAVILHRLEHIAKWFGLPPTTMQLTLSALRIPSLLMGHGRYYSIHAIERTLYALTRHGGPGFVFPGSSWKNHGKHLTNPDSPPTAISQELADSLSDPRIDDEMRKIAESTQRTMYSAVRRIATLAGEGFLNDALKARRDARRLKTPKP